MAESADLAASPRSVAQFTSRRARSWCRAFFIHGAGRPGLARAGGPGEEQGRAMRWPRARCARSPVEGDIARFDAGLEEGQPSRAARRSARRARRSAMIEVDPGVGSPASPRPDAARGLHERPGLARFASRKRQSARRGFGGDVDRYCSSSTSTGRRAPRREASYTAQVPGILQGPRRHTHRRPARGRDVAGDLRGQRAEARLVRSSRRWRAVLVAEEIPVVASAPALAVAASPGRPEEPWPSSAWLTSYRLMSYPPDTNRGPRWPMARASGCKGPT